MRSDPKSWPLALLLVTLVVSQACAAEPVTRANEYRQIAPKVWIHTSYKELDDGVPFPSNGLLVRVGDELLLVDTAWSDAQTREILEWAESTIGEPVTRAVVTHAHDDKMGGVKALHERGIATYASDRTNLAAVQRGLTPAEIEIDLAPSFRILEGVEVFYPGPGHTVDNIVVYVADAKILFAGCLVRPAEATALGNTADADVGHWAEAVEWVERRFPEAEVVVPSHGAWGDRTLLDHTIDLAEQAVPTE